MSNATPVSVCRNRQACRQQQWQKKMKMSATMWHIFSSVVCSKLSARTTNIFTHFFFRRFVFFVVRCWKNESQWPCKLYAFLFLSTLYWPIIIYCNSRVSAVSKSIAVSALHICYVAYICRLTDTGALIMSWFDSIDCNRLVSVFRFFFFSFFFVALLTLASSTTKQEKESKVSENRLGTAKCIGNFLDLFLAYEVWLSRTHRVLIHIFAYKLFCSRIDIVSERQLESSAITNQREIDDSLEHNVVFFRARTFIHRAHSTMSVLAVSGSVHRVCDVWQRI